MYLWIMARRGWWIVAGRPFGMPLRLHLLLPLGLLFFGGLRWAPGAWLAFVLVVVVHELGHAWMARAVGARPTAIDVHPLGGACRYTGATSPFSRALVAWGGPLAQLLLLVAALVAFAAAGPVLDQFSLDLRHGLVAANAWMLLLNLLPIPPFDGAEAFKVVPLMAAARARARRSADDAALESLLDADARGEVAPETRRLVGDLMESSSRRQKAPSRPR